MSTNKGGMDETPSKAGACAQPSAGLLRIIAGSIFAGSIAHEALAEA
jgi:hypothetical protein